MKVHVAQPGGFFSLLALLKWAAPDSHAACPSSLRIQLFFHGVKREELM